jgi:hypothetical protein
LPSWEEENEGGVQGGKEGGLLAQEGEETVSGSGRAMRNLFFFLGKLLKRVARKKAGAGDGDERE